MLPSQIQLVLNGLLFQKPTTTKGAVRCVLTTSARSFRLNPHEARINLEYALSHFIAYLGRIIFPGLVSPAFLLISK